MTTEDMLRTIHTKAMYDEPGHPILYIYTLAILRDPYIMQLLKEVNSEIPTGV